MTDSREDRYFEAMYPGGIRPSTERTAMANIGTVMAVADAEQEALRQECLDREATEQDVRARLADAEKALADLRTEIWDLPRHMVAAWLAGGEGLESVFVVRADALNRIVTDEVLP